MIFFGRHIRELMAAERCRQDDLRAADQEQFRAAVVAERVNKDIALASLQKQLDGLNELRKGVAMSVEVEAVDKRLDAQQKIVWMASGIAIAAGIALPILLR